MALPPQMGQTPLTDAPAWSGRGGGQGAANVYAFQEFSKLFGRNPTQSELDQFSPYYMGGDPNIANTAGGNQAVSSYFQQQQQAANAPQQESQALQQQIPIIQNLVNAQTQAQAQDLMNPNSPTYQTYSGMMNNMGISPSSGAFQSGLGGELGRGASQSLQSALGAVGLPIASGYSQGQMAPFQQAMQQPQQLFGNNLQFQNMLQEIAAVPKDQGSGMWGDMIGGGLQGAAAGGAKGGPWGALAGGAAGAGGGYARSRNTWICTHLKDLNLATEEEVDAVHKKLRPSIFRHPIYWLHYLYAAPRLIVLCDQAGVSWDEVKRTLIDSVLSECDPEAAWQVYKNECRRLCDKYAPHLWSIAEVSHGL